MADYFDPFWQALEARIAAVWTDADIVFRATQTKRVNWRTLIESGAYSTPFAVTMLSPARGIDTAGMANRTSAYDITFFYIRDDARTAGEQAGGDLAEDSIEAKLKALSDDLYPTPETFTAFQVVKQPDIDISAANAVNSVFAEASAPYLAGAISIEFVIGETQ